MRGVVLQLDSGQTLGNQRDAQASAPKSTLARVYTKISAVNTNLFGSALLDQVILVQFVPISVQYVPIYLVRYT